MRRGMGILGLLLTAGLLYAMAMHAAGIMVQYPASGTVCRVTEPAQGEALSFPFAIEGTSLIAERVICYEGPKLESGSDEPVASVLALVVSNSQCEPLRNVELTLTDAKDTYHFRGSVLPGQAQTMLVETEDAPWTSGPFLDCSGTAQTFEGKTLAGGVLGFEDVDMGTVAVTNLGEKDLENIQIHYKNFLPGAQLYLGGVTYTLCLELLQSGETLYLRPERYASGYSRIVLAEEKQ